MTTIWCKKLGLAEIFLFSLRGLFSNVSIRYDDFLMSSASKRLLQWLQRMGLCLYFHPANIDFDAKDEHGLGLMYRENRILSTCSENFIGKFIGCCDERYRQMLKTYIRGHIEDQLLFITYVETKIQTGSDAEHVIYIEPNPVNSVFIEFYAAKGITIKSSFGFKRHLKHYVLPYAYAMIMLLVKLIPFPVKTNLTRIRPAVWLEYSSGERNELGFWRKHLRSQGYDIVYYLDRLDTPVSQDTTTLIEKKGVKWIDAHVVSMIRLSGLSIGKVSRIFLECVLPPVRLPAWLRVFQFNERLWYLIYASVYKRFQVKLLIQHQDRGWKQAVQARALESAGGIMLG